MLIFLLFSASFTPIFTNFYQFLPIFTNFYQCSPIFTNFNQFSLGCHGDSGGPLSCQTPGGVWKQFGVVSWGNPQCNGLDRYTVYTKVSSYIKWIEKNSN